MTLNTLKLNEVKKWISFQSEYTFLFRYYIKMKGALGYELLETDGAQGSYKYKSET